MNKTAGSTPATIASDCLDHSLSQDMAWAASVLTGAGEHFPKVFDRFLCVVIRKLYLAGLLRLGCLACVPRCRESCFADGFTHAINLLPRYNGRSNGHGPFGHCQQGVSRYYKNSCSIVILQAHAANGFIEPVELGVDFVKRSATDSLILILITGHNVSTSTCFVYTRNVWRYASLQRQQGSLPGPTTS